MSRTDARAPEILFEEAQAQAPAPELGELLGSLAHELRNPLASLQGCAQTLVKRGEDLPAAVRLRMADVIARQAERMDWLVRAVGSFASPGVPGDDVVDLADLLREAGAASGVEVRVEGGLHVLGGEERLRLALEAVLQAFGPASSYRLVPPTRTLHASAPDVDPSSSGRHWRLEAARRMVAVDGGRLEVGRDGRRAVARLVFPELREGPGR